MNVSFRGDDFVNSFVGPRGGEGAVGSNASIRAVRIGPFPQVTAFYEFVICSSRAVVSFSTSVDFF